MKPGAIGFDRRLKREWLDATAALAASGAGLPSIRCQLDDLLAAFLAESGERGARSKSITVLCRIWAAPQRETDGLRADAWRLWERASDEERLALHWGLSMATYPFFYDVVSIIGRLLALQAEVRLWEITRRAKERWGDRERVSRSARHVVQSIRDWDVLVPSEQKGVYRSAPRRRLDRPEVVAWMLEALLRAGRVEMAPFRQLQQSPALFPFSMDTRLTQIRENPRLELGRQGLDEDILMVLSDGKSGGG